MKTLSREEWIKSRKNYQEVVTPYTEARISRSQRGEKDPVYDFLFEYYSHPPGKLIRWSPGLDVALQNIEIHELEDPHHYIKSEYGVMLHTRHFPIRRLRYLHWAIDYLQAIQQRQPYFGCFGLHEWAMVYQTEEIRHRRVPLRLGSVGTNKVVDHLHLNCTHYDAYRFFTEPAIPKNLIELSRANTIKYDQPGCIHVIMDLYKFCYKIAPWIPSDIQAKAFRLAIDCRILDMQASPYDLTEYGYEPISIELKSGREQYINRQRELALTGFEIRHEIIQEYKRLQYKVEFSKG